MFPVFVSLPLFSYTRFPRCFVPQVVHCYFSGGLHRQHWKEIWFDSNCNGIFEQRLERWFYVEEWLLWNPWWSCRILGWSHSPTEIIVQHFHSNDLMVTCILSFCFRWRTKVTMVMTRHAASSCRHWQVLVCPELSASSAELPCQSSTDTHWSMGHSSSALASTHRPALRWAHISHCSILLF